ncbi:MAG: class I SAM-dependent methyltransferase [Anaerolineae bacterium]|nr:class I SAM-dependent methyltransferase [Anaerolineae bacterium]
MIRQWGSVAGARILENGCGLGAYAAHLLEDSPRVVAFDIEHDRAAAAHQRVAEVHVAAAEALPYPDASFDLVISNEVIEHVQDDNAAVCEMVRVLAPGGRLLVFCPNRWYPVEQHGHYWRGKYHFGNTPLVNYLPNVLRNRLAPHVRVYTRRSLLRLFAGQPVHVVHYTRIFGAYDNIIRRSPVIGKALRAILQGLEHTPLRVLGLSHFLVVEKTA